MALPAIHTIKTNILENYGTGGQAPDLTALPPLPPVAQEDTIQICSTDPRTHILCNTDNGDTTEPRTPGQEWPVNQPVETGRTPKSLFCMNFPIEEPPRGHLECFPIHS